MNLNRFLVARMQDEEGVDCGGTCPTPCSTPALPPDWDSGGSGSSTPPDPTSPTTGGVVVKQSGQRYAACSWIGMQVTVLMAAGNIH
jgi:hypothetical protein